MNANTNISARLAYASSRRRGQPTTYVARCLVESVIAGRLGIHSRFVGIGDTRQEAEAEAIRHMHEQFHRERMAAPEPINVGKVAMINLDNNRF